jgi:hypothetical protein
MESRPWLTSFQIGGAAADALAAIERGITELTAQYRLPANYYSIVAESLMF